MSSFFSFFPATSQVEAGSDDVCVCVCVRAGGAGSLVSAFLPPNAFVLKYVQVANEGGALGTWIN